MDAEQVLSFDLIPLPRYKNTVYVEYLRSIIDERPEYESFCEWLDDSSTHDGWGVTPSDERPSSRGLGCAAARAYTLQSTGGIEVSTRSSRIPFI